MSENDQTNHISEFNDDSLEGIAKEIVVKRMVLIVHLWAYLFINLLLFIINYLVDYDYRWHFWVLTSWGLILSLHGLTYLLYKQGIENLASLGMVYHAAFYVLVNLFLLFVDWFSTVNMGTEIHWFWYPLGLWGVVLVIHLVVFLYVVPKKGQSDAQGWMDRKIEEEMQKIKNLEGK